MNDTSKITHTPPAKTVSILVRFGLVILLAFMQALLVVRVALHEGWTGLQFAGACATAVFSVVVFFLLWCAVLSKIGQRWARALTWALFSVYVLLLIYHGLRLEPLSFLIVYKNGADLFSWQALTYLVSNASILGWIVLAFLVVGLLGLLKYFKLIEAALDRSVKMSSLIALVLFNVALVAGVSSPSNELVEFSASVYHYFKDDKNSWADTTPYPYWQASGGESDYFDPDKAPNVFIVMLESFSAEYIDKVEAGQAVTPFFNQLKQGGFYLNNFFSGSVETSKGQFAALCSVYPSYKTNVFTSYPNNSFRCLPHILKERGYTNVFMKAFHSLDFENTGEFVTANGFDYAHGMDDEFITPQERDEFTIGWGVRDDVFYQKTFSYLDELHRQQQSSAPFFVATMSVTNHMMFDDIPPEQRYVHKNPQSHQDNYANSMYLTDQYLKTFFNELKKRDYLKNSIVVVFGDNGFPMGQHNNFHNTKTAYNEMFKTPLVVWWPGKVPPQVATDTARSQLDVAPTVIDLLNIDTDNHFVGKSVFAAVDDDYFVPLIQPFDGTFLGSLRYPYKYLKHLRTGQEQLFDIAQDPHEKHNLLAEDEAAHKLSSLLPEVSIERFRQDIAVLKRNEVLLKENRVYPTSKQDVARVILSQERIAEHQPLGYKILGDTAQVSVVVTVKPAVALASKTLLTPDALMQEHTFELPAEHLTLGVNRITFDVYKDGVLSSSSSKDVFVSSDQVTLLPELKAVGKQNWGKLHVNASVRGGPLQVAGKVYSFGLGTHASSTYDIVLDGGYRALHIGFGLDDESTCGSGAKFSVGADGQVLYTSARIKNGEYRQVLLDISGRTKLRLSTDNLGSGACDHTNWINPVLYRQAPAQ